MYNIKSVNGNAPEIPKEITVSRTAPFKEMLGWNITPAFLGETGADDVARPLSLLGQMVGPQ